MAIAKKGTLFLLVGLCLFTIFYACKSTKSSQVTVAKGPAPRVLVFIKTAGYYHTSIPDGVAAIQKLGRENNFSVDSTRDAAYFNDDSLKKYSAVVFLSTTLNVLNGDQQVAFERYIQAGGGYMGIHAAADCEYDWPWYNKLVGAYFASHPAQQKAVVEVVDSTNPATSFLPRRWEHYDELYNYRNINPDIHVLAMLDETTYQGGINGDNHPIAWYHSYDGGRAFYTGLGHTKESYSDPLFLRHLLGGLQYAIGDGKALDYSKSYAVKHPEDNRFTKTVLSNDLNEPMELAVAPDGRVFFTERAGKFYVYDPTIKKTKLLWDFPVKAVDKYLNGLIGITLDPDFKQNDFIYFFYTSNTGEQYHQNVSRFKITAGGNLDTTSEKIIIKIPIDLEVSAHTGGSLAWDRNKNLFISTGDNTTPFQSDGYAPIDEREGRKVFDAQRSAGNPNDLRGKILRIHPEPDGSYTIPEGNLFQKAPGTRPEIYVMGCRNPYRISVDTATSIVYWGEVGPDAGQDSRHGPRGYDEFNQAKKAGNYGWPYFVGKSFAYHDSDFATKEIGLLYDAAIGAVNNSPNNTGAKQLPPPNNPMVWYPYARSDEFPDLGTGGRCAMGGPVYHYDAALQSSTKLPAYYDKALFVYDWMRNWVFALRFDENNNYKRMEPFMQTTGDFRRPVDMEFGPDGSIYMLEYGTVYGIDNVDARLVRIDYNGGNRPPVAKAAATDTVGLAPLTVKFNSKASSDFDEEDALSYQWSFGDGGATSNDAAPTFSFAHNGTYKTVLTVTDKSGARSTDTVTVHVGNTLPSVVIQTNTNSSFFFPKSTALDYVVNVSDKEDGTIDKNKVITTLKYIPKVDEGQNAAGHQEVDENYNFGKTLIASSDCKACHQLNAKSVGPSFVAVSQKYKGNASAISYLANKIITGGGGVWGEHAMSAHPQLTKDDAMEIVKYVLSVSDKKESGKLPQQGAALLNQHLDNPNQGRYIFTASYTDNSGAGTPLTTKTMLYLRPSRVQVEQVEKMYNMERGDRFLTHITNGSYFMLPSIDLKDISAITYRYASLDKAGTINVRLDSLKGAIVSTFDFAPTNNWNMFKEVAADVKDPGGKHDLYFVFAKSDTPNKNLAALDWIRFEGGKEVIEAPKAVAVETKDPKLAPDAPAKEKSKVAVTSTATKPATKTPVSPGSVLITKSDCLTCHKQNATLVGPAFVEIATRYRNKAGATAMLANKIIKGGGGNWGPVPMTPHPTLPKKDATQIVQYILSLKK